MKRCPKCGRSYEDYWRVCLEDGVHLIDLKTIHKPHDKGIYKSLSTKETEEEIKQLIWFFITASFVLSVVLCFMVTMFSGSPFSAIRIQGKLNVLHTILYNAGTLTGAFVTSALLTVPLSLFLLKRR